jgi:hypothetical protein
VASPATVYALSLTLIAAVYLGLAVADGRPRVIAVEAGVAAAFVVVAAAGVTGLAWLLVVGIARPVRLPVGLDRGNGMVSVG